VIPVTSPSTMLRALWLGSFLLVVGTLVATASSQLSPALEDDTALLAFHDRIESYVVLHRRLETPLPPLRPTNEPFKTYLSRQLLANAIRKARPTAQQGDMFTPDVARAFRTIAARALAGRDIEDLLDEHGEERQMRTGIALQVNEPYPDWASHAVPPVLLQKLPPLADDLEYRIVKRVLVLWDVHANLVVDYLPNAFARETT
jgi:hypothetical protein